MVASAEADELRRLAAIVDSRLRAHTPPGRQISPQSLLLAAMSLAHELEEERARRLRLEARSREMLTSVLTRIDAAIGATEAPEMTAESAPSSD